MTFSNIHPSEHKKQKKSLQCLFDSSIWRPNNQLQSKSEAACFNNWIQSLWKSTVSFPLSKWSHRDFFQQTNTKNIWVQLPCRSEFVCTRYKFISTGFLSNLFQLPKLWKPGFSGGGTSAASGETAQILSSLKLQLSLKEIASGEAAFLWTI